MHAIAAAMLLILWAAHPVALVGRTDPSLVLVVFHASEVRGCLSVGPVQAAESARSGVSSLRNRPSLSTQRLLRLAGSSRGANVVLFTGWTVRVFEPDGDTR